MSTNSEWVVGPQGPLHPTAYQLLSATTLRALEQEAAAKLPPHTLMQRAGLAVARLTLAYAPHAQTVWIACGGGNNGGDGLEAALHLQQWGKTVRLSLPAATRTPPADAAASLQRALAAGIGIHTEPPPHWDVCIDALLGLGQVGAPRGAALAALQTMLTSSAPIIAVDVPSGLNADTGQALGASVRARATLSFLALKPGLFTAHGRDACGDIWLNPLGAKTPHAPDAWLNSAAPHSPRLHASHKGNFGDVVTVGGATGMVGAALLAGTAALHAGAGRIYLALLDEGDHRSVFASYPALMQSSVDRLEIEEMTVVAGCGGGKAIDAYMPRLLSGARQLVLDADALNALARNPAWGQVLAARADGTTALTPHPLEAARLLSCSTAEVQANRLASAQSLAQQFNCTVVLKGSGSIIASPGKLPRINPTGNARLAIAGTGDVLAGLLGSLMAQGYSAFEAACHACYRHGQAADRWPSSTTLTAADLARQI
ncbi:bifunctional ADP-dependent NAD(P)H-hydrate dehydratase/NAD(P)H-hydrate epimerase [Rhodoferax sp. TH121]|uniref:NAD(P)H-hydrate dehydratase n=1 Tax=Rhodoferax sp. TH121 TaxID=2022803 RepID=UPI000B9689C6|nr:NAD(P)H-hydrate dehydratase [Rhodoferax sp. TH121]OYQ39999.1 bifunctional ADP-dependent NAD(P)H-hydrate dehydratase/NAD(P)H-hydrate epimerase [Rhodoferax sp. TH121]